MFASTINKEEILNTLNANQAKIKSFGVRKLSLFGSSVRGEDSAESDLDFLVEFERKSFDADLVDRIPRTRTIHESHETARRELTVKSIERHYTGAPIF